MFSAIRHRLRLRSVRARLTFWYLLTLGSSLLAFAVFVFAMRAETLSREMDAGLEVRLHELSTDLRPELFALDIAGALASDGEARGAELLVRESPGPLVFRSPAFPPLGWSADSALTLASRDRSRPLTIVDRAGAPMRVASLEIPRPGASRLVLQLGTPVEPLYHALRQLAIAMLAGIIVVLSIASYGSGITARRALAPVDEIVARARRIQAERLGDRLDVHAGSAELDRLVLTLNEMLDRIEASMRTARRFAADASHELQTPLTVMRGVVEDAVRRGDGVGGHARASELLAEIERCSTLVRDLRLLALAEAGQIVSGGDVMDLSTLTQECSEIARAIAEGKDIQVETTLEGRLPIAGSALHLRRVILNLTDNAIRYSAPGSIIHIRATAAGDRARLSVADHGCGIEADELGHIFEPFYRTDPARARDTGGTGLGLAIADQIVRAHRGGITVTSQPGVGSTFTMTLPLAAGDRAGRLLS
jgi:signal transduction histidine kinase